MSLPALLEQRLRLPVVAAPMFLISNPQLVLACCRNGVVGSFPALNQRESSGFKAWLEEIEAGLAQLDNPAPYAVNLIVHNSNPRLEADLAICVEHKVPIVITSLGAVKELVDAVHSYGGLVFHDVTTRRHAEKAAEAGVDGLIAVAAGAGGHAGTWSPFSLIAEIRQFFDKTLLLAGCLNHGHEILAAQVRVAVGRFHFKHAVAQLQNGNVECSSAQVEHGDFFVFLFIQTVGERRRRRLVDNAQNIEACNATRVFGGLTL